MTERRPGVFWKVLWDDGDHKALLVRYAPGATIPRHRHLGDEQVFVQPPPSPSRGQQVEICG